jgi:hypothetical protein
VYFEDDEAKGRERLADAVPVLKALASWVEKPGAQALIEPLIAQLCEAVGDMKGPIDEGDAWELYSAAEAIVPEQAGQRLARGLAASGADGTRLRRTSGEGRVPPASK